MDNIIVERYGADSPYELQMRSDIGRRSDQQDNAYAYCDPRVSFAIVCDGMGGTDHGALASQIAVKTMQEQLKVFLGQQPRTGIVQFLVEAMTEVDTRVFQELGRQRGGTTAVAVLLQDGKLYWFSVGDSRLYILRDGELVQATRDHNYLLRLTEQLQNGEITQEEFRQESERGEALISFMGIGGLSVYDLTRAPLELMQGDILLLTTDGLYKAIPQDMIQHILQGRDSLSEKADKLMKQIAVLKRTVVLDNTTYALIEINTRGVSNE